MKVKLAVDIFRPEMVAALRTMHDLLEVGFENVEPLCTFLERMWKWFCYHDVSNWSQAISQRLEIKRPFSEEDDERIKDLDFDFPEELREWNKQKGNPLECFTPQTLNAIIFTSRSTANLIKHLLRSGFKYVLTRRLSTDNIESCELFICNRSNQQDSTRPNSLSCNTPLPTESVLRRNDPLIASERQPKITRPRGKTILMNTSSNHLKILNQLKEAPVLKIGDDESDKEFNVESKAWGGKGLTKVLGGTSSARVLKACKAEYSNRPTAYT
ncbi:hypothetical protein DAPPUDRAFT_105591 [Daphnia pulex]|uniref:Uncharacterized protein n=1 Tax=Daphnia pulex TaxID=6669 RepID=E9GR63_DAPPU|nr:hypothetical protein DAPPUDRAFT_105591 [Daphnia pulex]|eukprot:EFX77952.1 hypothetical protein DAPPUDRAFT_105591 [Daphnia pulex]